MKPHIKWSTRFCCWICYMKDHSIYGAGQTPIVAYLIWQANNRAQDRATQ